MPVITDFRIVDDFYLWEAYQGINNARTIRQFRIVDNFYLYQIILSSLAVPGSTPLLTFRIPLTALQIRTLNSVPVVAIAAPGVGKAIEFISGTNKYTFVSAAYTSQDIFLNIDTAVQIGINCNIDLTGLSSQFSRSNIIHSILNSVVENKSLQIIANADSVVGDGTAIIYGAYRIITL